jgi:hypothetical protein
VATDLGDAALITPMYRYGSRVSEVVALQWDQINPQAGPAACEPGEERSAQHASAAWGEGRDMHSSNRLQ